MDYVLQEIQAVLGEEMPEADEVRTYLQDPDKPTELSTTQRIVAMDKLLECAEVNLRKIIKRRRVVMNQSEMMQIILQEFYRIAEIPRPSHQRGEDRRLSHALGRKPWPVPLSGMSSAMSSLTSRPPQDMKRRRR